MHQLMEDNPFIITSIAYREFLHASLAPYLRPTTEKRINVNEINLLIETPRESGPDERAQNGSPPVCYVLSSIVFEHGTTQHHRRVYTFDGL